MKILVGIENRFWQKVNKSDTCWLWIGAIDDEGYGRFTDNGVSVIAHRWIYERKKGKVPDNWEIHHNPTCPKNCVNYESHLTAVSKSTHRTLEPPNRRVNNKCKRGHEMTPENTYISPKSKWTICRTCTKTSSRLYRNFN